MDWNAFDGARTRGGLERLMLSVAELASLLGIRTAPETRV